MGRTAKYHEKDFSTLKEEFVGRDELIDDFKKYYWSWMKKHWN